MTSIVEVIQHYQRSIDSSQNNEARLLHCINKLYNLPIKVEHLQETGVGKTVNSLRKFNGEIGVAAKTLVTKWKAMVAAEEEPMDTTSQTNESENHNDSNGDDEGTTPHDDEEDENHNRNNTTQPQQEDENKHRSKEKKDKHKERHKDRSSSNGHKEQGKHLSSHHNSEKSSSKHSSEKHKSSSKDKESHHKDNSSSSSSKHKDKEREKEKTDHKSIRDKHKESRGADHDKEKKREEKSKSDKEQKMESPNGSTHKSSGHSSSSKSKHEGKHSHSSSKEKDRSDKHKSSKKDKERTKDQEKSSSSSSSKDKPEHKSSSTSSTSKSSTKDSDSAERKRRHNSDNDSSDFKSPQPKVAKVHKSSSVTPASKAESSPPQDAADEEGADDSFDSSMGANFNDVLGMLNVPVKKSKKSLKSPSTPASSSSSTSKKDTTPSTSSSSNANSSKINGTRVAFSSSNSSSYSTPSTSKSSTMKPDLLAPTAKLEPLDPSIALELPTISTNYKPMPLNQTVMDCVFNNSSSTSKPVRTLTDAEAITHGISSKTMRTKIYSGVRTGQTFQVPSLFDMCIRILQKNIDALEYTGGVPFEVLKPVLERATPQQLYVFEDYNPYLMEDSDVLWQQHVSRNYRTKKRLENESWREMFIRCQEEEERRLSVLKDSIKASQKIAAAPVRKTQLAFVDSMVKPPRNVLKKQEQYGTKSKMVATPAARVASLSNVTPNAAKTGDQRLRVPSTARDHAQVSSSSIKPKKAPLMQKTLQFIRGRHKR